MSILPAITTTSASQNVMDPIGSVHPIGMDMVVRGVKDSIGLNLDYTLHGIAVNSKKQALGVAQNNAKGLVKPLGAFWRRTPISGVKIITFLRTSLETGTIGCFDTEGRFATIDFPLDGEIGDWLTYEGHMVSVSESDAPEEPLLRLGVFGCAELKLKRNAIVGSFGSNFNTLINEVFGLSLGDGVSVTYQLPEYFV